MPDTALYGAIELVERAGLPLAILAWLTVLGGSIGMAFVLRRHSMRGRWRASLVVGALALVAHLVDYFVTLRLTPDLALEANPLWRSVLNWAGLPLAKWYGLSGKILVSVLSFELFAFYLIQRDRLFPATSSGLLDFQRRFGPAGATAGGPRWQNLASCFAFLFALLSPYCFYIALLNAMSQDESLAVWLPSPLVVIAAYLAFLAVAYATANYRAFRRLHPDQAS